MTATRPEPTVTGDAALPIDPGPGTPSPTALEAPARIEVHADAGGRSIVTVLGPPSRGLPAVLSRSLHALLDALDCPAGGGEPTTAGAPVLAGTPDAPGAILVDLGRLDPDEVDVERVLECARARARGCGVALQVLPSATG